jgi:hypothetical protein
MNAAAVSGMGKFYRVGGLAHLKAACGLVLVLAAPAAAQPPLPFEDRPPLGAEITVDALGELPSSANLFALLDTIVPDVIADRIEAGGTAAGSPSRVGAHGSTWTQTAFRAGDVDITNPTFTGLPLLMPGVDAWEHVEVASGMLPIDASAPGMMVTLMPKRPALTAWTRALEVTASVPAFNAGSSASNPPSIARLDSWAHGNLLLSGPVSASPASRVGMLFSATWNRATYFERSGTDALRGSLASAFLNVTTTSDSGSELRLIAWGQQTRDAAPHYFVLSQPDAGQRQSSLHTQASWQHALAGADGAIRAFAGLTIGQRTTDLAAPTSAIVERLRDGPVPSLLEPGIGGDRTWSLGMRFNRGVGEGRHRIALGADFAGASADVQSVFAGRVLERLNGIPARVWDFTDPPAESRWRERSISLFAGDTIAVSSRLTINGGVRFETVDGSAESHSGTVNWRNLLPRGGFHVRLLDFWDLAGFGYYGRYGHRLPLTYFAYGDPTAPTANIYRASVTATTPVVQGPIIQRLGPGITSDPTFSSIDPQLKRPHLDEAALGFEMRPHPAFFFRIAALGRVEHDLINVVDVGVPESTYSVITVPDLGIDIVGSGDDTVVQFYNRSPATFGADRYLLTNPSGDDGSYVGADIFMQLRAGRTFFLLGATAGRSEGIASNRGFGPLENDTSVLGEAYVNPNALAHAQGRVFTERGYTIKLGVTRQLPRDLMLGLVARYQDGQHFARLVILPGLNQGAEAVRAFRNGRTRFSFTSNLDVRLQKGFTVGGRRLVGIFEAFNLFDEYFEYEEETVSGPTSRQRTATQPPFAMHIGIRIPF